MKTEKKYWIAGHGMGNTIDRVHDPITASAMWLGSGNSGIIHICADIIGLTNFEVNIVRDSLKEFCEKTNCKSVNISCSHTHAGFDTVGYWGQLYKLQTGKDKEYMDLLLKSLEEVVRECYKNRKPGKLYIGTTHVPSAQLDKREPVVLHDVLTRTRFVPDDNGTETWFINFAAHPNTLGGGNRTVSADYPYWLRKYINDEKLFENAKQNQDYFQEKRNILCGIKPQTILSSPFFKARLSLGKRLRHSTS